MAFLDYPIGLDDMYQYDMLARSILEGRGYRWYQQADVMQLESYLERHYRLDILPVERVPEEGLVTTFRAPGYPLFLAGVYALSGLENRLPAARIAQALLSAAMAPLTALLAGRLRLHPRAGVLGGLAVAVYPMLWFYPLGLGSENTFMLLLLAGVWLLIRAGEERGWRAAGLAGVLLGAAALTRGSLVVFLPMAVLWIRRRAGWRAALALTAALAVLVIPWSLRNSLVLDRPAFLENSLGYNLFVGYHPDGDGDFRASVAVLPLRFIDDGVRDRWTTTQALDFIRSDPARAVRLNLRRLAYFWGLEGRELIYFYTNNFLGPLPAWAVRLIYILVAAPWLVVAASSVVGLSLTPGLERTLILALVLATLAVYVPVLAEPRFHLPLVPFLAVYAGAAWRSRTGWAAFRARLAAGDSQAWLAVIALAILLLLWGWDLWRLWPRLAVVLAPGANTLYLDY